MKELTRKQERTLVDATASIEGLVNALLGGTGIGVHVKTERQYNLQFQTTEVLFRVQLDLLPFAERLGEELKETDYAAINSLAEFAVYRLVLEMNSAALLPTWTGESQE